MKTKTITVIAILALMGGCSKPSAAPQSPSLLSADPIALIEALTADGTEKLELPRAGDLKTFEVKRGTSWAAVDYSISKARLLDVTVQGSLRDEQAAADFSSQLDIIGGRLLLPEVVQAIRAFPLDRGREEAHRVKDGQWCVTWDPLLRRMTVAITPDQW